MAVDKEEKEVLDTINGYLNDTEADPEEGYDLIFDGIKFKEFTPKIKEALEKLGPKVTSISANDCALKSLENFPVLPELVQVIKLNRLFLTTWSPNSIHKEPKSESGKIQDSG